MSVRDATPTGRADLNSRAGDTSDLKYESNAGKRLFLIRANTFVLVLVTLYGTSKMLSNIVSYFGKSNLGSQLITKNKKYLLMYETQPYGAVAPVSGIISDAALRM